MPLALYMDVHVPRAVTNGLRRRDVDVITAQEDGDAAINRPLYTQDDDLLAEAHRRQTEGVSFAGVIYSHQLHSPIGRCVNDLEIIAKSCEIDDLMNRIEFISF
jgi:hypothetical protein